MDDELDKPYCLSQYTRRRPVRWERRLLWRKFLRRDFAGSLSSRGWNRSLQSALGALGFGPPTATRCFTPLTAAGGATPAPAASSLSTPTAPSTPMRRRPIHLRPGAGTGNWLLTRFGRRSARQYRDDPIRRAISDRQHHGRERAGHDLRLQHAPAIPSRCPPFMIPSNRTASSFFTIRRGASPKHHRRPRHHFRVTRTPTRIHCTSTSSTSLTTPYGVTQFSTGGAERRQTLTTCPAQAFCNCEMTKKWVQATDPLGRTSRVESCEQAQGIPTDRHDRHQRRRARRQHGRPIEGLEFDSGEDGPSRI